MDKHPKQDRQVLAGFKITFGPVCDLPRLDRSKAGHVAAHSGYLSGLRGITMIGSGLYIEQFPVIGTEGQRQARRFEK